MVTDPIGDLLTRIRNAQDRRQEVVIMPTTKLIVSIAEILKKEGFIVNYKVEDKEPQGELQIQLKYVNGTPAIRELKRISKPGVRRYRGYRTIKTIKNGLGISIFSTPMGVISGEEAVKNKVGGEYLCFIY